MEQAEFAVTCVQFTVDEPAVTELVFDAGFDKSVYPDSMEMREKVLDVMLPLGAKPPAG